VEPLYNLMLLKKKLIICKRHTNKLVENEHNSLYKFNKTEDMIDDLYITGGHSVLVDKLNDEERTEMNKIDWPIHFFMIEDKYKLLAKYCSNAKRTSESEFLYHLVLEQEDENDMHRSYGINANGVWIESCNMDAYKKLKFDK